MYHEPVLQMDWKINRLCKLILFCSVCWETYFKAMYVVDSFFFFQERALLAFLLLLSGGRVIVVVLLAGPQVPSQRYRHQRLRRLCKLGFLLEISDSCMCLQRLPYGRSGHRGELCLEDLTTVLCQNCILVTFMPSPAWFDAAWLGRHGQW